MISVQKVIFPGMAAGILFLVFITSLIANPHVALASNQPMAPAATAVQKSAPPKKAVSQGKTAGELVAKVAAAPTAAPAAEEQPPEQAKQTQGECTLSPNYPDSIRQWCGLIEQYAQANGIEPSLIAAVMQQESGGNPQAYSKDGAVGLLQVMPRDGLAAGFMCVNGPCFAARPSTDQLYDPEFNISYGTRMLAGLVQKYGGNIREALRAYGPMNMGYNYADIIMSIMQRNQ